MIDPTLGMQASSYMMRRCAELSAERDRLKARNAELVEALTDLFRDWKDEVISHCNDVGVPPPDVDNTVIGQRVVAALAKADEKGG